MKTIEELRKNIDQIDDKLAKLYIERMENCKEIGLLKARSSSAVNVPGREKEIINRITSITEDEDIKIYLKQLYENIFFQSKAYQSKSGIVNSAIADKIRNCYNDVKKDLPVSATIACQGVEGAYSGVAAEKLFAISDISYFKSFDAVFSAVDKGLCEYGVLPIENSYAGSVSQVYDLIKKHSFYIVKSIKLQVSHVLATKKAVKFSDVKTVYSHEQALSQCSDYIKKHNLSTVAVENTAVAGRFVAESDRDDIAAICSEECAKLCGLKILEKGVQDSSNNFTRFICISKDMQILNGADKISVVTSLENKPGSLNKMLSRFAAQGLNLTKLESRPIPNCQFEFLFYFDFEGQVNNEGIVNLIAELDNNSDKFMFLGCYKEII